MNTGIALFFTVFSILCGSLTGEHVQASESIQLPPPPEKRGQAAYAGLEQTAFFPVLSARRNFPPQLLSNLLWAACGTNRPKSGRRTAPSAVNWQEIDVYVAMKNGLFLYRAEHHRLALVLGEDIRRFTGIQGIHTNSPRQPDLCLRL